MAKDRALSDEQVLAIVLSEIDSASGYASGELADERSDAMDRYLGEKYGDEVDGRSQVRTREVYETVEMILPSLVRIFCDSDNMITFDAVGPEDVRQAEIESDVVNHFYWKENRGFYNTYSVLKDGLMSKTGIVKIWCEDQPSEREEYEGLNDVQLGQLLTDQQYDREIIEYERTEDGHHVVFDTQPLKKRLCIEPMPPEEFGIDAGARSPYVKDANFCYHRSKKTYGELIEAGYDKKKVESLPFDDDVDTQERQARRNLTDEWETFDYSSTLSMRTYWVTEAYIKLDRDGDDINELLKVTLAAGAYSSSNGKLLDIEEVDSIPFCSFSPILLTHKFYGLSIADLTKDLQEIKTVITRQLLDNLYLANNSQMAAHTEYVNIDDLLTKRPGGIVRFEGTQPWESVLGPIRHTEMPHEAFGMLEYLDEMRKHRTGAGDEVAGLDKSSLQNINTGVFALAYDMARMKIELIARICAEVMFRPLFKDIHELLLKNQDTPIQLQIRGEWQQINPSDWRHRENTTVHVGVGQVSRERKMMALDAIMSKQAELIQAGGMGSLIMPHHQYQSYRDYTKAWGLEPSLYWQDPRELPPPQPKQPNAQERLMDAQAQALLMDGQNNAQRNKLEVAKARAEAHLREQELMFKTVEARAKTQLEDMRSRMTQLKTETEMAGKVASMQAEKEKQMLQAAMQGIEIKMDHMKAERDRQAEIYKIQLDSLTKQLISHGITADPEAEDAKDQEDMQEKEMQRQVMGQIAASVVELTDRFMQMQEEAGRPKEITRDGNGLIIAIGGKPVARDRAGRITAV